MVLENELEFCNESEEYLIEDLIEILKEEIQKLKKRIKMQRKQ